MIEAACFDDAGALLTDCPRQVLKQTSPVPRINMDLCEKAGLVIALPADVNEACGILAQRTDVAAIVPVDRDAST